MIIFTRTLPWYVLDITRVFCNVCVISDLHTFDETQLDSNSTTLNAWYNRSWLPLVSSQNLGLSSSYTLVFIYVQLILSLCSFKPLHRMSIISIVFDNFFTLEVMLILIWSYKYSMCLQLLNEYKIFEKLKLSHIVYCIPVVINLFFFCMFYLNLSNNSIYVIDWKFCLFQYIQSKNDSIYCSAAFYDEDRPRIFYPVLTSSSWLPVEREFSDRVI